MHRFQSFAVLAHEIKVVQNTRNVGVHTICLDLARTKYIRCIHGILGRKITKYTAIYGVYIRFWPTLHLLLATWRKKTQHPPSASHS